MDKQHLSKGLLPRALCSKVLVQATANVLIRLLSSEENGLTVWDLSHYRRGVIECGDSVMPEFIVPPKYKQLFNEYDLSVIKADHYVAEREDLRLYRNTFLERIKQRYPNRRWLLPPVLDTISKIEGLSDAEFSELMKTFRYV